MRPFSRLSALQDDFVTIVLFRDFYSLFNDTPSDSFLSIIYISYDIFNNTD